MVAELPEHFPFHISFRPFSSFSDEEEVYNYVKITKPNIVCNKTIIAFGENLNSGEDKI